MTHTIGDQVVKLKKLLGMTPKESLASELKENVPEESELSNCCSAPVIVYGAVTKHYRCSACKEACDTLENPQECQTCKEVKEGSPTPDGDDICQNCGSTDFLDYEEPGCEYSDFNDEKAGFKDDAMSNEEALTDLRNIENI